MMRAEAASANLSFDATFGSPGPRLPVRGYEFSAGGARVVGAEGSGSTGLGQRNSCGALRMRMTFAGMPATTALAGTSLVTTELVPTMALSPTRTPRRMQAP